MSDDATRDGVAPRRLLLKEWGLSDLGARSTFGEGAPPLRRQPAHIVATAVSVVDVASSARMSSGELGWWSQTRDSRTAFSVTGWGCKAPSVTKSGARSICVATRRCSFALVAAKTRWWYLSSATRCRTCATCKIVAAAASTAAITGASRMPRAWIVGLCAQHKRHPRCLL